MTKSSLRNVEKSEMAQFISWNDGSVDARRGAAERSKDFDYVAGYRHAQHMMAMGA